MRAQTVFSTTATTGGLESEIGDKLRQWMASDLSKLDLLVFQIDGLRIHDDLVLVAALGIDGSGHKYPLGLTGQRIARQVDRQTPYRFSAVEQSLSAPTLKP